MHASTQEYADIEGISYGRTWALLQLGMPHTHLDGRVIIPVAEAGAWRAERRGRVGRPRKDAVAV